MKPALPRRPLWQRRHRDLPRRCARRLSGIALACAALVLGACEEMQTGSGGLLSQLNQPAATGSGSQEAVPRERLTQHDAALRFLTAYIRLDRNLAQQVATPEAISKLDWNRPHGANIPYYDDRMLLIFNGGTARVYFQEVDGSFRVSDLEVRRR